MPYFTYHAINKSGQEKTGTIIAESKNAAVSKIKKRNLYLTKIYQMGDEGTAPADEKVLRRKKKFTLFPSKVKNKEIATFIGDLSTLIDAGIPMMKALGVLEQQTISPKMREITQDLRIQVESGHSLSESLKKYHNIFPELHINLIRAGEVGGGKLLTQILIRLADLCENTERLNARIRSALAYPIFVLLFALLVVVTLVTFILPKFFVIYDDLNLELPFVTAVLFNISMFLKKHFIFLTVMSIISLFGAKMLFKFRKVRLFWDKLKLKLPVFGEIFQKVAISRFARNFGALLNSGVPILKALDIIKDATGNLAFTDAIEKVKDSVREGESISGPLSQFAIFPPLVTNMIALGEETGNVGNLLIKVSDKYDEETETLILQLTSLLEPFLIMILGVFVGFIIFALFFPLLSVMQSLSA